MSVARAGLINSDQMFPCQTGMMYSAVGKGEPMRCQRCAGLVVSESFGLREESASMCSGARCINCGWMEDPVVHSNRLNPQATSRVQPRRQVRKGGTAARDRHDDIERHALPA